MNDVWICDLKSMTWTAGPALPSSQLNHYSNKGTETMGYFKGTAYCLPDNTGIVYSGGASLRINGSNVSNQIYEYVPNTKVLLWRFNGVAYSNSWKVNVPLITAHYSIKFVAYCISKHQSMKQQA